MNDPMKEFTNEEIMNFLLKSLNIEKNEQMKYCMEFTNEEIINFLVNPLKKYSQLDIRFLSNEHEEIPENTTEKIVFLILDGDKRSFYLDFCGYLTSLFTPDVPFSEQFMFIDDRVFEEYLRGSDLYGNIFYEGMLSNKTPKEILELILKFVEILIGTTKIEIVEIKVSDKKVINNHRIAEFVVKLTKDTEEKKEIIIENIKFIVN